jgi:hypothetical protein
MLAGGMLQRTEATQLIPGCGEPITEAVLIWDGIDDAGPATLGPQAPRSGQLAAGFDADILVLDADPLADIEMLACPARVTGVRQACRWVR